MRKFLWCDYFHDSIISDISFSSALEKARPHKDCVTLTIHCRRDWEKAYTPPLANARPDNGWAFLTNGDFTYFLLFCGVEYFEIVNEFSSIEYLNGRFKNTQAVREWNVGGKRLYYHFRIQILGGYMDIIFNGFKIKKAIGRVNYSAKEYLFDRVFPREAAETCPSQQPVFPVDTAVDDFDCFIEMQKLFRENSPALAAYARQCLKSALPIKDAKPYAAYVLGKVGEKSDLDLVREIYFQAKSKLQKRHILDAIESLEAR